MWSFVSNQALPAPPSPAHPQVVDYLGALLATGDSPGQALLALLEQCLSREGPVPPTRDNVTVVLARLKKAA
jgi:hypothetical protein